MSYNVHSCVGCDSVLAPDRIAEVIALYQPDVVALQELDVARPRTGGADQPALIAGALKMHHHFHPALEIAGERYGDAILSRFPLRVVRAGPLPTLTKGIWPEPRGVLWVSVECDGGPVQVLNTHLGLSGRERAAQAETLLGPDWLGHPDCTEPRVLCGDFNAWPLSPAYRRLHDALPEAKERRGRGLSTFPSRWPLLRLDHVFHSPDLAVSDVRVPRTRLTRLASDHLPLIVEVTRTSRPGVRTLFREKKGSDTSF
jgi:endonuclease/exonuclease/phosphatase family metal-dependent hydrolase